jgi:hypothetical protein
VQAQATTAKHGLFRCPWCSNDEHVDSDDHEHDGECGDRVWPDELPALPYVLGLPVRELSDEARECLSEVFRVEELPDDVLFVDLLLALAEELPESKPLERFLADQDVWHPTCPCCNRRAELLVPLVPVAS